MKQNETRNCIAHAVSVLVGLTRLGRKDGFDKNEQFPFVLSRLTDLVPTLLTRASFSKCTLIKYGCKYLNYLV